MIIGAPVSALHSRYFFPTLFQPQKMSSIQVGARFAKLNIFPLNQVFATFVKNKIVYRLFFLLIFNIYFGQKNEYFSDSKTAIKANQYKIEITQNNNSKKPVVYFNLYRKSSKKWLKIQSGNFTKESTSLYVTTDEDLNNDGYNDLKISFAQAARGANEIEKLLIFNPKLQKLIEIVNSQEYPNLHYNSKRNCINSYMFSGSNTTLFFKLRNNKLENFAKVEFYNDSVYSYKIKKNQEILLKKRTYQSSDAAIFFSDFDPITE